MRGRWVTVALLAAWIATRSGLAWVTLHDDQGIYRNTTPAANDLVLYEFWADKVAAGARPYEGFDLEYPPANLPMLFLPAVVSSATGAGYHGSFVGMAIALDAVALGGLLLLARGRSLVGPAAWTLGLPILGPVALSRLDLVPAAAFVWCIVAITRDRWRSAGVALGIAAGTKVFAGLLAPAVAAAAHARGRHVSFLVALSVALAVPMAFYADIPGQVMDDVWGYHSGRGVAAESAWGSLLLAGETLAGTDAAIELRSGSWEIVDGSSGTLKFVASFSVVGVAAHSSFIAWRGRRRTPIPALAVLLASTVVLSVGLGNIFSAQYVVWCLAAVAAASAAGADVRWPALLIVVAAALTHLVFPLWFVDALFEQRGIAVTALVARNGLVLACGVLLLRRALAESSDPAVEQHERVPSGL